MLNLLFYFHLSIGDILNLAGFTMINYIGNKGRLVYIEKLTVISHPMISSSRFFVYDKNRLSHG